MNISCTGGKVLLSLPKILHILNRLYCPTRVPPSRVGRPESFAPVVLQENFAHELNCMHTCMFQWRNVAKCCPPASICRPLSSSCKLPFLQQPLTSFLFLLATYFAAPWRIFAALYNFLSVDRR